MAAFHGRWSDHPTIKTKKGRCSFCRKKNRIVAPMQNSQQFCGSCMIHVLHIIHDQEEFAMRWPYGASSWDKLIKNGLN